MIVQLYYVILRFFFSSYTTQDVLNIVDHLCPAVWHSVFLVKSVKVGAVSVLKPTLCQHLEKYNVCGRQMISKYTFVEKNEFMNIKNLGVEAKMTGKYTSVSTRGILD